VFTRDRDSQGPDPGTDTADNLLKSHRSVGELRLEAKVSDGAIQVLGQVPGVKDVSEERDGDWSVFTLRLDAECATRRGNHPPRE
jgi:ABC-2 type transport system ATP-binding protein